MNKYILILIFLLYNTSVINYFNNKSNYSSYLIIPLINVLLIKYYFGNYDNELVFSLSNIIYWLNIITISIIILYGLQILF